MIRRCQFSDSCHKLLGALILSVVFAVFAVPQQALGQSSYVQPDLSQRTPLTLPQLYWSFLSYQIHLDNLAAQRESQGQNLVGWFSGFDRHPIDRLHTRAKQFLDTHT